MMLFWLPMRTREHNHFRHRRPFIAALCILAAATALGASSTDAELGYREFRLGRPIAEARSIIAAGYRGMAVQHDTAAHSITIVQNEQNNERVVLRFDGGGTLFSITALLGRDKDSTYLSKLLNFLENKYGKTTVESGDKDRGFIWRAVWRLQNGRYGINAEYSANGVAITYLDIATDDRIRGEALRKRFDGFKAVYLKAAGTSPATLQFAEFRLGETRANVASLLARRGATASRDGGQGKCRNGRPSLTARLPDGAELHFFFDNNDALYELIIYRPDSDQQYIVELLRFMRTAAGAPVYANEQMLIGRWEFEQGRLLFTASFTDRATASFIDKGRLDRCIADAESKLFKDL